MTHIEHLSSLLLITKYPGELHVTIEARLDAINRDRAAFLVAWNIVCNRCSDTPYWVDAWSSRYNGGPPHNPEFRKCLAAFIASGSIGTPDDPANDVHLQGLVAEHIWHLLVLEDVLGFGEPVNVEAGWASIDPGGDGLVVYCDMGALSFRLWESKAHTGNQSVRDVINGACRQIDSNALQYLARFSKIKQSVTDAGLQHFYASLPEMWVRGDRNAGGGVSVATKEPEDDCFDNLYRYWSFAHKDQRQGMTIVIDDFQGFSRMVRSHLWKGL